MTSKQNIEGALLLNEEPLKRCHDCFAVCNRQADVTVGQIIGIFFNLKFATLSASDLIGPFNTDFPAHFSSPLLQFAASKARFGSFYTPEN